MCHEFVGPEHVPMDFKDVERVLAALTALEEVGRFNSLLGHSPKVVDAVLKRAETFFEMGMWYGRKRITDAAVEVYRAVIEESYTNHEVDFDYGRNRGRAALRQALNKLADLRPTWVRQKRRIERLFSST